MSKGVIEIFGQVFDIERFAIKDGPGIRTVVFLKGCNLSCDWCQNPESQNRDREIMYYGKLCRACGRCIAVCPEHAISEQQEFGLLTDKSTCIRCGQCVDACYYGARKMVGRAMTISEVMADVRKDKAFYDSSGGGITISGGEPLLQPDFTTEILKVCKEEGIHTVLETAGAVGWRNLEMVLPFLDLIYFDIKCMNPELHRRTVGVDNAVIHENVVSLSKVFRNVIIRIPVIPEVNDTVEEQSSIYSFVLSLPGIDRVELLPFHRLGLGKYRGLGRRYSMEIFKSLRPEACETFAAIARSMGLEAAIAGG